MNLYIRLCVSVCREGGGDKCMEESVWMKVIPMCVLDASKL